MSTEIKPDSWSRHQLAVMQRLDRLDKMVDNSNELLRAQGREQIEFIMESMKEIRQEMTTKVDSSIRDRNDSYKEARRDIREKQEEFEEYLHEKLEKLESSLTAMGKVVASLKQKERDYQVKIKTATMLISFLCGGGGTGIALLIKWMLQ